MNKELLVNPVPSSELTLSGVVAGANIKSVFKGNCSYPFGDVKAYTFKEVKENILADKDIIRNWHPVRLWSEEIDCYRLYSRKDPDTFVDFLCIDGQFIFDCKEEQTVTHGVRKSYFNKSYYQRLGLTKAVIAKMVEVEKLHQSLSYIGLPHLMKMVQHRVWDNCPIEAADVLNYSKYMHRRSCIGCNNGKTTNQPQVRSEEMVHRKVSESVCFDLLFLTTEAKQKESTACIGLLGIDSYSLFKTVVWIKNKKEKYVIKGLQKTIKLYKSFGHNVKEIRMDNERGAINLQDFLADSDPGTVYNPSLPHGHVALVESTIRHLKNLWRSTILGVDLDGLKVPRKLYKAAFIDCIHSSNIMLTTVNDYITPSDMFYNTKACYRNYMSFKWGDIVSCRSITADEKDENSRIDYGLVVGRSKQHQLSGLLVYNLKTKKIVVRGNCIQIECNKEVKELIKVIDNTNDAVNSVESKPGLHIISKENTIIPILDEIDLLGNSFEDLLTQALKEQNTEYDDNYFIDLESIDEEIDNLRDEINDENIIENQSPHDQGGIFAGDNIGSTSQSQKNIDDECIVNNDSHVINANSHELMPNTQGYAIDDIQDINSNVSIEGDTTNNPIESDYAPNISYNNNNKKSMYKYISAYYDHYYIFIFTITCI